MIESSRAVSAIAVNSINEAKEASKQFFGYTPTRFKDLSQNP